MKTDKKLGEVFNVEPAESQEIVPASAKMPVVSDNEEKIEDDYTSSRQNLHKLLYQGEEALLHALEVAKQSEHPRAFEVVGGLIKQLADVNDQFMDLHAKREKMKKSTPDAPDGGTNITNNSIFVGSTSELNKMLNKMRGE